MTIPMENRHLLERKFGRALADDRQRVTMTLGALSLIIDAVREEERARRQKPSLFDEIFGPDRGRVA